VAFLIQKYGFPLPLLALEYPLIDDLLGGGPILPLMYVIIIDNNCTFIIGMLSTIIVKFDHFKAT